MMRQSMGDNKGNRAYVKMEGRWRHVYILRRFEQLNLFSESVPMIEFKLSEKSRVTYISESSLLLASKPVRTGVARGVAA